jgi:hypothetical protein
MTRNRLGDLQRNILHNLPRNKQESKRGSLTVREIRLKIKPESSNVYSTEQSIRRALRQLQLRGYVDKSGDWDDLHSESREWRLTDQAAQLVSTEIRLSRRFAACSRIVA